MLLWPKSEIALPCPPSLHINPCLVTVSAIYGAGGALSPASDWSPTQILASDWLLEVGPAALCNSESHYIEHLDPDPSAAANSPETTTECRHGEPKTEALGLKDVCTYFYLSEKEGVKCCFVLR